MIKVLVAGTAGGVGVTTVTALLFAALQNEPGGAPQLLDHSAGVLGLRLPEGDDVRALNAGLALHDVGPHAAGSIERLTEPQTLLIMVAPATPLGCAAADRLVGTVVERHGARALRRVLITAVGVFGRHRIAGSLRDLGRRVGTRSVILLPQDLSLAAGGRIPTVRLATHSIRAQRHLTSVVRERLRSL